MKTLSERNPWGYLICSGIKPIENRTWPLPKAMKGERVLIHASAKPDGRLIPLQKSLFTKEQWASLTDEAAKNVIQNIPVTSAIIGSVDIVDCVINRQSIWAEQSVGYSQSYPNGVPASSANKKHKPIYNWILKNPVLFNEPILNVKGQLSFFKPKID
jgi:hypothetical protein